MLRRGPRFTRESRARYLEQRVNSVSKFSHKENGHTQETPGKYCRKTLSFSRACLTVDFHIEIWSRFKIDESRMYT